MLADTFEQLPEQSDPKGVDGDFVDFQAEIEELYPGLITEPEIFIESLEQEAIDSIHPAIREIMNRGWYPELAENLKNTTVWNYLQDVVVELNNNFPIERLEVAREVLKELKDDSDIYDTADDPQVEEEIDRILRSLCPELMQKFEATEDSLEDVVGIFPENRINMLFDSLKRRSERDKAYDEYCKLGYSKKGYREKGKVLKSLSVLWRNYGVLHEIYPKLLEDPDTLTLKVRKKEIDRLEKQYGWNPGLIKNPEFIRELSNLELFFLIYTVNKYLSRMDLGNMLARSEGIVKTVNSVRFEKFFTAGKFLIQYELKRRFDEDSNLSRIDYLEQVCVPWFCFNEKFFSWEVDCKLGFENALEVELLMRALKDGHEEDIKEFLPEKDAWRKYVTEQDDVSRLSFLL